MRLIEQFRGIAVAAILDIPTFRAAWPARRAFFRAQLGPRRSWTADRVVALGEVLSEAFALGAPAPGSGRTQASLSAGGTAWEALVCYYLNLCYAGTNAVVVRTTHVPPVIRSALTVTHDATPIAADVDALALCLPTLWTRVETTSDASCVRQVNELFEAHFREVRAVVLACKTNWNDSVQTPMLWNLLYGMRSAGIRLPGSFSIGTGRFSPDQLDSFKYAFVTVPTQGREKLKVGGAPVERAKTMSGGYFWGWPSTRGICQGLTEFFVKEASIADFPPPAAAGQAFAAEARTPTGEIDLSAFALA